MPDEVAAGFGYGVVVLTNSQDHDNVNENLVEELLLKIVGLLRPARIVGLPTGSPATRPRQRSPPRISRRTSPAG